VRGIDDSGRRRPGLPSPPAVMMRLMIDRSPVDEILTRFASLLPEGTAVISVSASERRNTTQRSQKFISSPWRPCTKSLPAVSNPRA